MDASQVAVELAQAGVDPASILYVFSWGFGAVISCWFLGYCVGVAVRAINKT